MLRRPLILVAAIFVLRAVGLYFGVLDIDETDTFLIGKLLGEGAIPYVDVVEKKPLFFYVFYSPAALFGWRLWPLRLIAVGWVWATCLFIGGAARRWTDDEDVGLAAAWLCALISACNTPSLSAEMLLNLPAAAALYFFVRAEKLGSRREDFLVGIAGAFASRFKHQGGIVLVALSLALLLRRRPAVARLVLTGLGFALPWVIIGGAYFLGGHFDAFYEWNVRKNLHYSGSAASGSTVLWFLWRVSGYVLGAAPVAWLLAVRQTAARPSDSIRVAVLLTLWLTWIPVCLGGRFYDHYFLQFAPPLALAAAPRLVALFRSRWRPRLLVAALLLPVIGHQGYLWIFGATGSFPAQDPKVVTLTTWLRDNTPRDARLFVWGQYTPVYYLSQRMPGTRYYTAGVLVGDFDPYLFPKGFDPRPYFSAKDIELAISDMEKSRCDYVVDTAPADIHDWAKFPLSMVTRLDQYVAKSYVLAASPAGAPVYRRR
jgi:4-amino-4-deoxy-L-arabinose transferase-like glycosyltransferase